VLPVYHLRGPILSFAGLCLAAGLGGALNRSRAPGSSPAPAVSAALGRTALLYFASLLFLYGGLETCLAGWLTTYTLRYSDVLLFGGQSPVVLLFAALTLGRALASAAMRFISETATHSGPLLSLFCLLLGLSLAPFFPSTFAVLMRRQPGARTAGFILAVSGLGAALFPWLMGVVSTQSGSLRIAMAVPFLLALALLGFSLAAPAERPDAVPAP
jgi:fucose permease